MMLYLEFNNHNNKLKHAKIEPFIIPNEDELKALLEDPKKNQLQKDVIMRQIGARCLVCGKIAKKIVKYRMYGMIKIEKYCDECLERAKD